MIVVKLLIIVLVRRFMIIDLVKVIATRELF